MLKLVCGGQTGVDRAAADVARKQGLPCTGWCPKGRRAEDGPLAAAYPLQETPLPAYSQRTEWNVRDSDGTLILNRGKLEGGTAETQRFAQRWRKPCLVVDLDQPPPLEAVNQWLQSHHIRTLNIAGPRESKRPGIYRAAVAWLERCLVPRFTPL